MDAEMAQLNEIGDSFAIHTSIETSLNCGVCMSLLHRYANFVLEETLLDKMVIGNWGNDNWVSTSNIYMMCRTLWNMCVATAMPGGTSRAVACHRDLVACYRRVVACHWRWVACT